MDPVPVVRSPTPPAVHVSEYRGGKDQEPLLRSERRFLLKNPEKPVDPSNQSVFWATEDAEKAEEDPALLSALGLAGLGGVAEMAAFSPNLEENGERAGGSSTEDEDEEEDEQAKERASLHGRRSVSGLSLGSSESGSFKKRGDAQDPFAKDSELETLTLNEVNQLFAYNLFMVALIYFEMLEIPFRLAFNPVYPFSFFMGAAIIDLIFVSDMVLRFYLPYFHADGHYVKNPQSKIRRHYRRTWFLPHLMAALPWDFFWLCIYMADPILSVHISYFKFLRLTRFTRLPEVFLRLDEWEVALTWYKNPIWFRAMRIVLGLLLWITTNSCIFWLIGRSENLDWNWIHSDVRPLDLLASSIWVRYLTSIYWGMVTFSTVGYGDIAGSTVGERGYIIFFALLSIAVTAYSTGNVVTWLQSAEAKRTVLADQLDVVKSYIKYRRLPLDLGNKLLRFHRFRGLNSLYPMEDSVMLEQLPSALRLKICRVYRDTIFKNWRLPSIVGTLFLTALVMRMRRETRYPGEFIAVQGTRATRFYILTSGHAVVIRNGVEVIEIVSDIGGVPGVCLEEMVLFTPAAERTSTLRAVDSCELLYLERKDLRQLLVNFPDHAERIEEYGHMLAKGRAQLLQQRVQDTLNVQTPTKRRRFRSASVDLRALDLRSVQPDVQGLDRRGDAMDGDVATGTEVQTVVDRETSMARLAREQKEAGEMAEGPEVEREDSHPHELAPEDKGKADVVDEPDEKPLMPLEKGEAEPEGSHSSDSDEGGSSEEGRGGRGKLRSVFADLTRLSPRHESGAPTVHFGDAPADGGTRHVPSFGKGSPMRRRKFRGGDVGSPAVPKVLRSRSSDQLPPPRAKSPSKKSPRTHRRGLSRGDRGSGRERSGSRGQRRDPDKGFLGLRVAKKELPEPTAEELTERVKQLEKMPGRMFEADILNDPTAIGEMLSNETTGLGRKFFTGADVIDWLVKTYDISREDALYLGRRVLRSKGCFYAVGENADLEDNIVTRFRLLSKKLSTSTVYNLLDVDVAGGTVTKEMQRIIASSVTDPSSQPVLRSSSLDTIQRRSLHEPAQSEPILPPRKGASEGE